MPYQTTYLDRRRRELMRGEWTVPLTYAELREAARQHLPEEYFAYLDSAAGTEGTLDENRRALDRHRLVPRILRDCAAIDISVRLFGRELPAPLLLAPIGTQKIFDEEGEVASARAAGDLGIPFVLSTAASRTIEEVAESMGDGPRLFQLYYHPKERVVDSYLARAEQSGYDAIVVTVDAPVPRWIPRNLQNGFRPSNVCERAIPLSDPAFEQLAAERGCTVEELVASEGLRRTRSLTWDEIDALRERTSLPVLVKGVVHPDDSKRAVDHADGVVVSTHGGRQMDGTIGAADALPAVADAVDGRIPVLFDSGVRSGVDVYKALALGADAVMLGRSYVFGLAIAGQRGVTEVVENVLAEFESAVGLAGHDRVADVGRKSLMGSTDVGSQDAGRG